MGDLVLHNSSPCGSGQALASSGRGSWRETPARAGEWDEAGDSQGSERALGTPSLVPANPRCSECRE